MRLPEPPMEVGEISRDHEVRVGLPSAVRLSELLQNRTLAVPASCSASVTHDPHSVGLDRSLGSDKEAGEQKLLKILISLPFGLLFSGIVPSLFVFRF